MLHSSKGLVEVLDQRNLAGESFSVSYVTQQFTHESVRQYILDGGLAALHPSLQAGRDVEAASHAILAGWCQKYLQSDWSRYIDFPIDPPRGWLGENVSGGSKYNSQDYPLLEYSMRKIFDHIDAAYSGQELELRCMNTFPLEQWINLSNICPLYGTLRYLEPTASLVFLFLENSTRPRDSGIIRGMLEHYLTHSVPCDLRRKGEQALNSKLIFGASLDHFCGGRHAFPLMSAVARGYADIVQLLLECGAAPNILDPLRCSLQGIEDLRRSEHAEDFLTGEFGMVKYGSNTTFGGHPLVMACAHPVEDVRHHIVISLLDHGADVNAQNGLSISALGAACCFGYWKTVELLLTRGADVDLKDVHGFNIALKYALIGSFRIEGQESHKTNIERLLPLRACARPADLNVFLHAAARLQATTIIELLLHLGAETHCRGMENRTLLHVLTELSWTSYGLSSTVRLLLELGIDADAHGGEYDTALIAASATGKSDLVKLLLEHGVDIGHISDKYGSALDAARASMSALTPADWLPKGEWEGPNKSQEFTGIIQMLSRAGPR